MDLRVSQISIHSGSSSIQFPTSQNTRLICRKVLGFSFLDLIVWGWRWRSGVDEVGCFVNPRDGHGRAAEWLRRLWFCLGEERFSDLESFGMFSLSDYWTLEIILNIYMVCVHSLQSLSYGERVYSEIKSTIALFLYLDSNQISLLVTIKLSLSFIDYNNFIDIYKYIFIEMNFFIYLFFIGRLIKRRKMKHVIITGAYEWERYP